MTWAQDLKTRLETANERRQKLQQDAESALADLMARISADSSDLVEVFGNQWAFAFTAQSTTTPEGWMNFSFSLPKDSTTRCGVLLSTDHNELLIVTYTSDGSGRQNLQEHSTVDGAHKRVRALIEHDMLT